MTLRVRVVHGHSSRPLYLGTPQRERSALHCPCLSRGFSALFGGGQREVSAVAIEIKRTVVVKDQALAPIAPAKELALECSTKDARKSKTIVDYRLSTILNSKCSTITPRARYKIQDSGNRNRLCKIQLWFLLPELQTFNHSSQLMPEQKECPYLIASRISKAG